MTHQQFFDLVCKMRTAQMKFFRTRLHDDLQQSKEYERQVDQALREYSNPQNQLSLLQSAASS